MENILVLEASDVALKDYRDLRLEALYEEPQAFGSSYNDQKNISDNEWQYWLNKYREGKQNWMVFASDGQRLIGMLGAYQTDEEAKANIANIIAVYVTKHARGKGVARNLLDRLLNKLTTETSIKKVKLAVNIDQIAAVRLYKAFGFAITGEDTMILGDGISHKEYLMEKTLSKNSKNG